MSWTEIPSAWLAWALFPIPPSALLGVGAAVGILALAASLSRRRHRRDHPQAAAYLVYVEWGTHWSMERRTRLAEVFPDVPDLVRAQWLADFGRLDDAVWTFAKSGADRTKLRQLFDALVEREFGFLDQRARTAVWCQAQYFAVKEGYASDPEDLPADVIARATT